MRTNKTVYFKNFQLTLNPSTSSKYANISWWTIIIYYWCSIIKNAYYHQCWYCLIFKKNIYIFTFYNCFSSMQPWLTQLLNSNDITRKADTNKVCWSAECTLFVHRIEHNGCSWLTANTTDDLIYND